MFENSESFSKEFQLPNKNLFFFKFDSNKNHLVTNKNKKEISSQLERLFMNDVEESNLFNSYSNNGNDSSNYNESDLADTIKINKTNLINSYNNNNNNIKKLNTQKSPVATNSAITSNISSFKNINYYTGSKNNDISLASNNLNLSLSLEEKPYCQPFDTTLHNARNIAYNNNKNNNILSKQKLSFDNFKKYNESVNKILNKKPIINSNSSSLLSTTMTHAPNEVYDSYAHSNPNSILNSNLNNINTNNSRNNSNSKNISNFKNFNVNNNNNNSINVIADSSNIISQSNSNNTNLNNCNNSKINVNSALNSSNPVFASPNKYNNTIYLTGNHISNKNINSVPFSNNDSLSGRDRNNDDITDKNLKYTSSKELNDSLSHNKQIKNNYISHTANRNSDSKSTINNVNPSKIVSNKQTELNFFNNKKNNLQNNFYSNIANAPTCNTISSYNAQNRTNEIKTNNINKNKNSTINQNISIINNPLELQTLAACRESSKVAFKEENNFLKRSENIFNKHVIPEKKFTDLTTDLDFNFLNRKRFLNDDFQNELNINLTKDLLLNNKGSLNINTDSFLDFEE